MDINITNAANATNKWVGDVASDADQMVKYALPGVVSDTTGWQNVITTEDIFTDACESCINPWQGYMIWSRQDNITLLRQN